MEVPDHVIGVVQIKVDGGGKRAVMPVRPPMPNIGINAVAKSIGTVNRIEPPQSEIMTAVSRITDGDRNNHRGRLEERAHLRAHAVRYMWCAQTRNDMKPEEEDAENHHLVAPERFAGVIGDDLSDDGERRQNQHINLGMRQEPEKVLARAADCRRRRYPRRGRS